MSFYTLTLNFILTLLETLEDFDIIISITNKFMKKITFVSKKKNYNIVN